VFSGAANKGVVPADALSGFKRGAAAAGLTTELRATSGEAKEHVQDGYTITFHSGYGYEAFVDLQ
jgi:hypothetical protein